MRRRTLLAAAALVLVLLAWRTRVDRPILRLLRSYDLGRGSTSRAPADDLSAENRARLPLAERAGEWPMLGGSPARNNAVPDGLGPTEWDVGEFDRDTGQWKPEKARNIKWVARLGSQTYGAPVVSGGHVYVGTNNGNGYLKRYPATVDIGCLLCFRAEDGAFLWQYSCEKLPSGRVHDWPLQGICSVPVVEDKRMWFVDNRGRLVCLDTDGFLDDEDDGPVRDEWSVLFRALPGLPATGRSYGGNDDADAVIHFLRSLKLPLPRNSALSVEPDPRSAGWIVFRRGRPKTPMYRVTPKGDALRIVSVGAAAPATGPEGLVVRRDEIASLRESRLNDELRARFVAAGIRLPAEIELTTIAQDRRWTLTTTIDGKPRRFLLELDGFCLTVSGAITKRFRDEADVVWRLDMMRDLGVSQHNLATSPPAIWGDIVFLCTSNGLDESHINIPCPEAPSFIAVDKHTGRVLWTDNSPGANVLHGQWSGPAIGVLGGVPQVIFAGGDGWVYSFRADRWDRERGKPIPLWRFDANPKESKWILGGRGTRNNIIAVPVIHGGRVYVGVGQDPEHGEGVGLLWCLDPTRRGDVSAELAMRIEGDRRVPIPHRRIQAVVPEDGEVGIDNPNSAVVWRYDGHDRNGDGQRGFEETMHRTLGSPAIAGGLLFVVDFSGLAHCLDAETGRAHWTCDLLSASWTSPLIVGDRVYVGGEDGDVAVFRRSADPSLSIDLGPDSGDEFDVPQTEINIGASVYSTPVMAGGVLYFASKNRLFAIAEDSAN